MPRHRARKDPQVKRCSHTPDQIVRKLHIADQLQAEGKDQAEIAKHLGIAEAALHRWRNRFGGMRADDAKRLKELENENRQLKAIVADKQLENRALKEIAEGKF